MTTVRGITSRVDIVWSSDGVELQRNEGVHFRSASDNSVVYTASYEIVQLSTNDDDKTYLCEMFVNVTPSVMSNASVTLNVTGKRIHEYILTTSHYYVVYLSSTYSCYYYNATWSHTRSYGR